MKTRSMYLGVLTAALLASSAGAQPRLISTPSKGVQSISNADGAGTYVLAGSFSTVFRQTWNGATNTLTESPVGAASSQGGYVSADGTIIATQSANAAPGQLSGFNNNGAISPPYSATPALTPVLLSNTALVSSTWNSTTNTFLRATSWPANPAVRTFGPGISGAINTPFGMSSTGRYVVGQTYVSTYNNNAAAPGTTINTTNTYFRPYVWDTQTGVGTFLPTPFRTSTQTWRARSGQAYDVSTDGTVVIGSQEHNVSSLAAPDPDAARIIVWRWNGTEYVNSFLPGNQDINGNIQTASTGPNQWYMNDAGTKITGKSLNVAGESWISQWNWNAGTQTWDGPVQLFRDGQLSAPASWLTTGLINFGTISGLSITGVTEDGNTVVGFVTYFGDGLPQRGGFIWKQSDGLVRDWYDYLVSLNVANIGPTQNWGPVGEGAAPNTDFTRGQPALGYPTAISRDGALIAGFHTANQMIIGAQPWILDSTTTGCVPPSISTNPTAAISISNCTSAFGAIFNVSAFGTPPFTYQWYKNGVALVDGPQTTGGTITGATTLQARLLTPKPGDAGTYYCIVTGGCGTAQTTNTVVSVDAATGTAIANDICDTAIQVGEGTFTFSPCGAYVMDPVAGAPSCLPLGGVYSSDVWYKYVPTISGFARIETCGANYDTIVSVFSDCSGGELECNDDYLTGPSTSCTSSRSRVARFAVTSGVPVWVRIVAKATTPGTTGSVRILAAPAAAPNDNCGSPTPAVLGSNSFDLTEASADPLVVTCNTATAARDTWYSWTAPQTGLLRVSTCGGTTLNTVLSIHPQCFDLALACNDTAVAGDCATGTSSQASISNFETTAGASYLIRLAGNSNSAVGLGTFTLTFRQDRCNPADIANDDGATPLPPAAGGARLTNNGVTEGDYNVFFANYFEAFAVCDIANDDNSPLPPFGPLTTNNGVTEADYNLFFSIFFDGCAL
jgi:hypothetical protein